MSEVHGAVGAYVMHALDGHELDEFEAHLAGCETCRREVVELREAAAELSVRARTTPPAALKGSVMAAIAGVRVLAPEEGATGQDLTRTDGGAGPRRSLGEVRPGATDELALRRSRRANRLLMLAVAAVTVVALALGATVVSLSQRQQPAAAVTAETELLRAPDLTAHTIRLKDGGAATFVASKSLNRALFSSDDLPALKADQTYQLWTLAGSLTTPTRVTPDALVRGTGSAKQWFTGPIAGSDAVAISVEKAGGAPAPTDIQGAATL